MSRWRAGSRAAAGLFAALLGCAVLAGCGGGSGNPQANASLRSLASSIAASYNANAKARTAPPTAPVDATFRGRADQICAGVLTYNSAHPNPYPSFNYVDPDPATLKKVGAYFAASPYNDAVLKLAGLGTPPTHPGIWQAFLTAAQSLRSASLQQNAAAIAGKTTEFVQSLAKIQAASQRLSDAAHQVGFTSGEACYQLMHVDVD